MGKIGQGGFYGRIEWVMMLRVRERSEVLERKIWADDCGRRLRAFRGEKTGASAQCVAGRVGAAFFVPAMSMMSDNRQCGEAYDGYTENCLLCPTGNKSRNQ